jgi:steroid delta-isomerase-like uncharacterized protein
MKTHFVVTLLLAVGLLARAQPQNDKQGTMNNKKNVAIWYDAFNRKDPALMGKIIDANWVDIPSAPNQKPGLEGMKDLLTGLTTTFPDFNVRIEEILQDGNKVIVRSELTGTQKGPFLGISPKGRKLQIQAVDIHEFKDGKIIRTWHTEDWMNGLRQLGLFEK